jgi:hypothetical protein
MASGKQIWFYDNDKNNETASAKINFIKVNDGGEIITPSRQGVVSRYFKDKLPELYKEETTDEYSGIQEEEITNLVIGVEADLVSAVVFDWDRTLTKTEGLYAPPTPVSTLSEYKSKLKTKYPTELRNLVELSDKDFVAYFFHNHDDPSYEDRPAMIGELLTFLNERDIPVFVLTNSKIGDHSPGLMSDMLSVLSDGVTVPEERVFYNSVGCDYHSPYISGKEQIIMETILPMIEYTPTVRRRHTTAKTIRRTMVLPTVEEVEYAITNKLGTLLGGIKKRRRRTRKRKRRKTKRKRKNKLSKTRKLNI